jgi:hypothetical protein
MTTKAAKRRISRESQAVEALLSEHFDRVEAYRFNAASIRVRIIDEQFRGLKKSARLGLVEPWLAKLPKEIETDIIFIVLIAAGEEKLPDFLQMNRDFEHPRKTRL